MSHVVLAAAHDLSGDIPLATVPSSAIDVQLTVESALLGTAQTQPADAATFFASDAGAHVLLYLISHFRSVQFAHFFKFVAEQLAPQLKVGQLHLLAAM